MSVNTLTETSVLSREHREVLAVVDELEKTLALLPGDEERALSGIRKTGDYLSADLETHLAREEEGLFPLLERRIGPDGPLRVMLFEHTRLRNLTKTIVTLAGQSKIGGELESAAGEIARILRDHIAKEDGVLFPLAERLLAPEQLAALVKEK